MVRVSMESGRVEAGDDSQRILARFGVGLGTTRHLRLQRFAAQNPKKQAVWFSPGERDAVLPAEFSCHSASAEWLVANDQNRRIGM